MAVGIDVSIGLGVVDRLGLDMIGGVKKSMSFSSFAGCWEIGVSSMIVLFCDDWILVLKGCESFWFLLVVSGG